MRETRASSLRPVHTVVSKRLPGKVLALHYVQLPIRERSDGVIVIYRIGGQHA